MQTLYRLTHGVWPSADPIAVEGLWNGILEMLKDDSVSSSGDYHPSVLKLSPSLKCLS